MVRFVLRLAAGLTSSCLVLLALTLILGAPAAYSREILYVTADNAERALFIADVDRRLTLTHTTGYDGDAYMDCSPDGKHIAFMKGDDIYVMDVNLGDVWQLTQDFRYARFPKWSPDGSRIAFLALHESRDYLYVAGLDDGAPVAIMQQQTFIESFDWSPDGRQIVVSAAGNTRKAISVISVETGIHQQLTHNDQNNEYPAWSPDGKSITYVVGKDERYDLYRMAADGTNVQRLTWTERDISYPVWSPDGSRIAYLYDERLYVMNADGTDSQALAGNLRVFDAPRWSPDGHYLTVVSPWQYRAASPTTLVLAGGAVQPPRTTASKIYVVSADGSGYRQVSHNLGDEVRPVWCR
jgi:Tol biopolymer transport system component